MKLKLILFCLLSYGFLNAQNCDYSSNVNDSIGSYRSTKDYLMSEKNFGSKKKYLYFSLSNENGLPILYTQFIEKSNDFIKVSFFDKNSKLYIQLENGKIITLLHTNEINCGTTIKDLNGIKTRVNTGYFVFLKGSFEDLQKAPITLMRFKIGPDTTDYIIKTEFKSEENSLIYKPSTYFINYLRCVE